MIFVPPIRFYLIVKGDTIYNIVFRIYAMDQYSQYIGKISYYIIIKMRTLRSLKS